MPHLPAHRLVLASGFTLGSLSPKTLWLNAALCVFLALHNADHFRIASITKLSPALFLIPAIWGIRQGMRMVRLRLAPAFLIAATITVLMISAWTNSALWIYNWLLLVPPWFLVAMARKSGSAWSSSASSKADSPAR